jgi:hypothetical protein
MPFATTHSVSRGIQRLMSAPRDLPASAPWTDPPVAREVASHAHQVLFAEYTEYLSEAIGIAEAWWQNLVLAKMSEGKDLNRAVEAAYERRFAGPACRPELVWTLRTFWLRCVAVNKELPEDERVPPEVFLLFWLMDGKHDEWVQVISGMPYWPIGLDRKGNWV